MQNEEGVKKENLGSNFNFLKIIKAPPKTFTLRKYITDL